MHANRLQRLFGRKKADIFSVYFTAGYPENLSVADITGALYEGGADMVEIGVPFSDPIADGPTIQESSASALRNGMTLSKLLDQIEAAREKVPEMPFVLMGYINPFLHYGLEALFKRCAEVGIDAMIVPDLPFDEYLRTFKPLCDRYGIPMVMLITPETEPERIKLIDSHCDGFIYMVSAASVTGTRKVFTEEQLDYFHRVNAMDLVHPRLIGFGISNPTTFRQACDNSAGAIIGSLFVKCLTANPQEPGAAVAQLRSTLGLACS